VTLRVSDPAGKVLKLEPPDPQPTPFGEVAAIWDHLVLEIKDLPPAARGAILRSTRYPLLREILTSR
jgi:hypothetical protein